MVLVIFAAVYLTCTQNSYSQNIRYFQTFGWSDDNKNLYYATDTSHYWDYSYNYYGTTHTQHYTFQDPYSTMISDVDSCFLVFPKRWHHNSCCNDGTFFGINANPYSNVKSGTSACSPTTVHYIKPSGIVSIPYYNILITNSIPKYREVVGIGEKTFYGCDSITKLIIPSTIKNIGQLFIWGCDMLDTIIFDNTFNEDTIYPPIMCDYTFFITHPITIVVPCNSYDTFYNYIHSLNTPQITQINIVPDIICGCGLYAIDTITVYDTIQVFDTTITHITLYDTVTINVYDTINIMTYDTIYTTITDTNSVIIYDTVYEVIYDTIYVFAETQETFDDLRLYPIPTRDYVNVEYNGYLDYKLYNNRGKLLEIGSVISTDSIDLTKYASGVYYFNAKLDNGSIVTKKIIKVTL